jgi:hypothetical protein
MFRQTVGGDDDGVLLGILHFMIRVAFDSPGLGDRVALLLVDGVGDWRFIWLVVGGHRPIHRAAWREPPELAVGLHDRRAGAIEEV